MALGLDYLLEVWDGATPRITGVLYDDQVSPQLVPDADIDSVTVSVLDYTTGEVLRAATAVTVSNSTFTTWLTEDETAITNDDLDYEYRVISIECTYASIRHAPHEAYIKVKRRKKGVV